MHHGNGTQKIFYNDPAVLFISLHQDGNYPKDTGSLCECGEGEGKGYNINVPLPPGSGSGAYAYAMEQVVGPAIEEYKPDIILVSCGLDASYMVTYILYKSTHILHIYLIYYLIGSFGTYDVRSG